MSDVIFVCTLVGLGFLLLYGLIATSPYRRNP